MVGYRALEVPGEVHRGMPSSTLTCHCTAGDGDPEAVAMNDALVPLAAVVGTGCAVTRGGVCTVSDAELLVAELTVLV